MVTSSEDGTVKIWDTRQGTIQRNYTHGVPVNDVVIHPNQGELISCDRGGNVRIWDLGENKCSHQLIPEDDVSVASVTVASDGTMLCAGNNAVWILLAFVPLLLTHHDLYLLYRPGQRLRLAHDATPGCNLPRPRLQIRRPPHLHNARPPLPRRPAPGHLLGRPHRPHLVRGHLSTTQCDSSRRPPRRPRPQRFPAGDDAARSSALGLGLRLQRGFCVPGYGVFGPLCAAVGAE